MENQNTKLILVAVVALLIGAVGGYSMSMDKNRGTDTLNDDSIRTSWPMDGTSDNDTSDKELALRQAMRKLWTDHVVWTRDYIIASVAGAPDTQAAADRLLKNQEDIGKAVAVYYGQEAGDKLTGLLKQHILIATNLINQAKAKDTAKFDEENVRWQNNGKEIADFLASANPNWPQDDMRAMMAEHLSATLAEVSARLDQKYDQDVRAFDMVYDHILKMSDALSSGIIKQFPERF